MEYSLLKTSSAKLLKHLATLTSTSCSASSVAAAAVDYAEVSPGCRLLSRPGEFVS